MLRARAVTNASASNGGGEGASVVKGGKAGTEERGTEQEHAAVAGAARGGKKAARPESVQGVGQGKRKGRRAGAVAAPEVPCSAAPPSAVSATTVGLAEPSSSDNGGEAGSGAVMPMASFAQLLQLAVSEGQRRVRRASLEAPPSSFDDSSSCSLLPLPPSPQPQPSPSHPYEAQLKAMTLFLAEDTLQRLLLLASSASSSEY